MGKNRQMNRNFNRVGEKPALPTKEPIAFVSEHSETLVELDIEYRELAEKAGVTSYTRIRTVGDDDAFIKGLADLVSSIQAEDVALAGPGGRRVCPGYCVQCPIVE